MPLIFVSVAANPLAASNACRGSADIKPSRWRSLEGDSFILAKLSPLHFTECALDH